MAIYKKRKYSSYRYGKSSLKSRTYGQYKSAKKGNDTLSFVVNSNQVFSAMYDPDTNTGTACVNVWEVLANNSNFAALASMYDQVRLDGVRVKLSVTDAKTTVNQINEIKNITIYTAWDKTGLSNDQYNIQYIGDKAISYNVKIGRNIVNASDQKKSQLNSFQRWNSFLSCYPSLLAEKSQYIATADIERTVKSVNSDSGLHYFTDNYRYAGVNTVESNNPCLVFESSSIKYKPCLLVGVFSNSVDGNGSITQYGKTNPVIFNGEFSMSLTFKNLKAASTTIAVSTEQENNVEVKVPMNTDNQMYVTENENYYEVEVDNFINSPYVTYNEKRQPYATSLVVEVPKSNQEKIKLDRVTWEGPVAGGDLAYERVQKDFAEFSVYNEDSPTPEPIIVEPGDEIVAVRETNDDYKIVNYHLPKTSTKRAVVRFAENCRYAVLKATQTAAQVSSFLMKCVNVYNKVAMIVPRFIIPLATVADYEANGSVNINGEEITIQSIDNNNAVELPVDTYVIEF